jgi:hypothetical protein
MAADDAARRWPFPALVFVFSRLSSRFSSPTLLDLDEMAFRVIQCYCNSARLRKRGVKFHGKVLLVKIGSRR